MRSSCLCEEPELSKHCQLCQMVVKNSFHHLFMAAGADRRIHTYSNVCLLVSKGLLWSPEDWGNMHSKTSFSLGLYCDVVTWILCCRKLAAVTLQLLVLNGHCRTTNLEVQIWAWQALKLYLIQKLELANAQNFCTNSVSKIVIENLKMFRTPHRTEILILFPIYRCLNFEMNSLWRKRRHCLWWAPRSSPCFWRLLGSHTLQWEQSSTKRAHNLGENQRHQFKTEKRKYFTQWLVNLGNVVWRQTALDASERTN